MKKILFLLAIVSILALVSIAQAQTQAVQAQLTDRQLQINQEFQQINQDISKLYRALKNEYPDSIFSRTILDLEKKVEKLRNEFVEIGKKAEPAKGE